MICNRNSNSAITSLTRTGNSLAGYGNMDQLTYTYTGNRLKAISDGGYLNIEGNFVSGITPQFIPSYHYYFCDHQGNTRVVANGSGAVKQVNEYYPYGVSWGDASTYQGFQKFKYNGKELDRMHGLFWYDYGARRYDPAVGMFTQVDPLCEQYPHLNPYLYCAGNPVRYVDPDGRHIKVKKDKEKEGLYTILGGEVDDDLNIYDVSNGWENRISIGKALTQFSFFNDDGRPVEGSIINLNDKSGLVFWSNFEKWAAVMPLGYYALNAYKSQKYDFKRQGEPYPGTNVDKEEKENQKYHNRGMILNVDGKAYIASGRDIGNYAAGYYAGLIGLTWQESRFGFNALES